MALDSIEGDAIAIQALSEGSYAIQANVTDALVDS
jgi:hypothetical protein